MSEHICRLIAHEAYADNGAMAIKVMLWGSSGTKAESLAPVRSLPRAVEYAGSPAWLSRAADIEGINTKASSVLCGMDIREPQLCDKALEKLSGTLSPEAVSAVSSAIHKASSKSLGVPLYAGLSSGERFVLPIPVNRAVSGSRRYGGPAAVGIAPSYSFAAFNFPCFEDAHYALWEVITNWAKTLSSALDMKMSADSDFSIPIGRVESDIPLLEMMSETIEKTGNSGKVGIAANYAACKFFDRKTQAYSGIFSSAPIARDDMPELLESLIKTYPIIITENLLCPEDICRLRDLSARHKLRLAFDREMLPDTIPAEIDSLCISASAQTVSELKRVADSSIACGRSLFLRDNGYEDVELCDYAVALGCDMIRDRGLSFSGNRLLHIEKELGKKAKFAGFPEHKNLR